MARGRRNDQNQIDPDIRVNFEGETLENTIEPTERVQDGLQGQNSTTNNGRNGNQLHHVDVQYQVREESPAQRTSQPSNARNNRDIMMSQS